jgi:hypothetical protein
MEKELYREAQRRVREKAKFYKHLYIYLAFNAIFLTMSFFRGRAMFGLAVPFFWGIGLLFHYLKVFGLPGSGILSKEWEDREIQKEFDRLKNHKNAKPEDDSLELREVRKNYNDNDLV